MELGFLKEPELQTADKATIVDMYSQILLSNEVYEALLTVPVYPVH